MPRRHSVPRCVLRSLRASSPRESGRGKSDLRGRVKVRVAHVVLVGAARTRVRLLGPVLQFRHHTVVLVHTENDEVARMCPRHRVTYGVNLLDDHLDLLATRALGHLPANTIGYEGSGFSPVASTQRNILADNQDVEVVRRDGTELSHVVVATVASGGDDADA